MENEGKFLPIGTVVLLKGGKRELMINSYCITTNGDVYDKNGKVDAKGLVFDYGACFYPEGMITSDQLFAFNHEQIEKIAYMGYKTEQQKQLSDFIIKETSKAKETKETTSTQQETTETEEAA